MALRTLSPRENKILVITFTIILIYVGYNFIFKSLRGKGDSLDKRIEAYQLRLKKNQKILRKQRLVDRAYAELTKDFKQEQSAEQEMTLMISEIESVANKINMRVTDMKPKNPKKLDFYNKFTVSLSMDGELVSIMHFLYLLENKPHNFAIDEIRLERSFGRSAKLRCRLTLSRILIP